MKSFHTACLIVLALASACPAAPVDFARDVRPILQRHCWSCHGEDKQKSGLRLDIKSEAFRGGEAYGPSVVGGDALNSPLIQFIADEGGDLRMPPEGEGLSATEIETLTRWVNEGAGWPDGIDTATIVDRLDHWSFKPLVKCTPPSIANTSWPQNDVDRFILHRLEQQGLQPSPPAERVAWIRRVYFDLIGLPPTPEQVAAFVQDSSANSHEKVVDELLASPRYGERWAQHWLDVVRYADTHGFEVNTERPHAWPYRDYVIRALNVDTPYDQFIREQIVGDALGQEAATGFLITASVLLPGQIGKDEPSIRLARQDALDEIVTNISQTFLGLSVGCARCHDHKFDPISQRDYYAMQAFVAGVEYEDRELHTPEAEELSRREDELTERLKEVERRQQQLVPLARPRPSQEEAGDGERLLDEKLSWRRRINPRVNVDRFDLVRTTRLRFTVLDTNSLEPCLDEIEIYDESQTNVARDEVTVTASGSMTIPEEHELQFVNDGNYGNGKSWISETEGEGWVEFEFAEPRSLQRVVWGRDREGPFEDRLATQYRIDVAGESGEWLLVADSSDRIPFKDDDDDEDKTDVRRLLSTEGLSAEEQKEIKQLGLEVRQLEEQIDAAIDGRLAFAGEFREPDDIHVLSRGDPEQPKDQVLPTTLSLYASSEMPLETPEQERRRFLADWIARPDHPLTARVIVNRVWQGHFGTGLVESSSDFGHGGMRPSHPELLDWLAARFISDGWSLKKLHRLIVLSATYRQASQYNPDAATVDADARLLWRYPPRRLDSETLRDSMLAISGELNLQMHGRGYNLFDKRGGLSGFTPIEEFDSNGLRRMIYAHKVRRERDAVFGSFDCPDGGQSTAVRRESYTPIQALNLFNSRFTLDRSRAFVDRVIREVGDDVSGQIARAYWLALSRSPTQTELQDAEPIVREHGLSVLCRALFNSNEALFVP